MKNAWNHYIQEEYKKWQEAIQKEINYMIKQGVWEKTKKITIPSNPPMIRRKWVFKKKGNGLYRAQQCQLGYVQVSSLDYTDHFSLVLLKKTFPIVLILLVINNWVAEIVYIETVFLYGDLEEEIYLKVPRRLFALCKNETPMFYSMVGLYRDRR